MGYFLFNGIKSTDMGIIVSELPSITKPPKLYEKYDVQGAEKSIIYDLGYQSYTKQMTIGLKSTADVNLIMSWLSGSGKFITSDEPDKYYYVQFLDQQNYEKLARFRQATITMLCQPYKYKVSEVALAFTGSKTISNTGNTPTRPTLKLYGTGNASCTFNGITVFTILGMSGYITIDALNRECKKDDMFKNRSFDGDFSDIVLPVGNTTIAFGDNVTSWEIGVNTRWI